MRFPLANAITLSRILFFAIFIWLTSLGKVGEGILFFILAWGLDAVDGWVARKRGEASAFGSLLDKVVDRTILIGAGVLLIGLGLVPPLAFWLFVKDLALAPALTIALASVFASASRRSSGGPAGKRIVYPGAGALGRATSVLQGVGFLWLLLGWPNPLLIIIPTALLGAVTAFVYTRELARS